MFLDAHVHLWRLDDGEHFWMREKIDALYRDFTLDDLARLGATCGVGGAIAVQAMHNTGESLRLLRLAEADERIAGVVAWADLFSPSLRDDLARFRESPQFAGVRPLPPDTFGGDWLDDPRSRAAFGELRAQDISVDLLQRVENLSRARVFLRDFPDMRIVLNHGGRPAVMTGMLEPWRSDVTAFARETTAVVKCSGLVERAGVEWSKASVAPYVATLLEAFGPRRVMFATNWPVMTISANYALWVRTLLQILDDLGLSADERDDVMWRTAATHYRVSWPPAARLPHPPVGIGQEAIQ